MPVGDTRAFKLPPLEILARGSHQQMSARSIEDDCALRSKANLKRTKLRRPNLAASLASKGKRFCDMVTHATGGCHGSVPPGENSASQPLLSRRRGSRTCCQNTRAGRGLSK